MKLVIIQKFDFICDAEDFANKKAKEGYRMVNICHAPNENYNSVLVCMELTKFERDEG